MTGIQGVQRTGRAKISVYYRSRGVIVILILLWAFMAMDVVLFSCHVAYGQVKIVYAAHQREACESPLVYSCASSTCKVVGESINFHSHSTD